MYGNAMYEVARQRVAEQQRDARTARQAREQRAAPRASTAREEGGAGSAIVTPAIPDFAHEMFGTARRRGTRRRGQGARGRHAGTATEAARLTRWPPRC